MHSAAPAIDRNADARPAIDGVSDYTHFTMHVDNTIFDDSGKAWPIRDVRVTCVTE